MATATAHVSVAAAKAATATAHVTVTGAAPARATGHVSVRAAGAATATGHVSVVAASFPFYRRAGSSLVPVRIGVREGSSITWLTPPLP